MVEVMAAEHLLHLAGVHLVYPLIEITRRRAFI